MLEIATCVKHMRPWCRLGNGLRVARPTPVMALPIIALQDEGTVNAGRCSGHLLLARGSPTETWLNARSVPTKEHLVFGARERPPELTARLHRLSARDRLAVASTDSDQLGCKRSGALHADCVPHELQKSHRRRRQARAAGHDQGPQTGDR